jgi:multiple sugar transport system ATP-binding protein
MAGVVFESVGKVYPDGTRALDDLRLEIEDGEFMVFVGPSGCGKTTALRMVAGLEEVSEGSIRIGDTVINDVLPQERDIAMVFQNYALYPHMTVAENIGFGLRMRKLPKAEIKTRVAEIAQILGLGDLLDRRPRVLSGGQRQRVAMGRAIVRNPRVLLMDEPLSNLDAKLRVQMRTEIARIQREIQATTIYVTHDQVEAMTMGDRVAVMRKGVLQQVDAPQRIYEAPANIFVATFIGSPPMNLLRGTLERNDGGLACSVGGQRLAVPPEVEAAHPRLADYLGREVAIGVRPEHGADAALADGLVSGTTLRGTVAATELLGSDQLVYVDFAAEPVVTDELLELAADVDAATLEGLHAEAAARRTPAIFRLDVRTRTRPDAEIEIALQPQQFHFFDLESGAAI